MLYRIANLRNILQFLIVAAIMGISVSLMSGQSQTANQRGFNLGNSFSISDFETINTTNGNLMLRFPLAQLPSGRGGLTAGVFLTYQSKLFDTKTEYYRNQLYSCQVGGKDDGGLIVCPYYKKNKLTVSDEGGWKLSAGYSLKFEDRRAEYANVPQQEQPQCTPSSSPGYQTMTYVHKLYVIFPDGSQHEMIPEGHTDILNDRFYRVRYDGLIENCGGTTSMTGSGLNYYSVDGSYVRMSVSYDGNSNPNDNTWTLFFPDGSRYESLTGRGYDRNGNWIQYLGNSVSDQFGRSISVSLEPGTGDTLVTANGPYGEPVFWRIKYKSLAVTKKYNPWAEEACVNGTCPPDPSPIAVNEQLVNVVSQLVLPSQAGSNLAYTFSYNTPDWTGSFPPGESTGFGELSGITLPDASAATASVPAQITYTYALDGAAMPATDRYTRETLKNRIASKTLSHRTQYDGTVSGPITETWTYSISETGATINHPNGSQTSETYGRTSAPPGQPTSWDSGLGLTAVGPDGTLTERIWSQNFPGGCPQNGCQSGLFATNPYVKAEFTSIKSGGNYTLTTIKDYKYDKNGNVLEVREFDWMPYSTAHPGGIPTVPASTTYLRRITKNEYFNPTPEASQNGLSDGDIYLSAGNPRLLRLIQSSEVQDAGGTPRSRSEMDYDHKNYFGSNTIAGNLTQTKAWDSFKDGVSRPYSNPLTSTNSISTSTIYNACGMPTSSRDAKNIETTITYDGIGGNCGLYPITTVTAANTSVARTSAATYDFYTGLTTSVRDVDNGNATTSTSYDAFRRPVSVTAPNGATTNTTFNDVERYVVTRSDVGSAGDQKKVSTTFYDQLGRVRLAKTLEDAAAQSETNETDGIKVQTRYLTLAGYTYQTTSNPYRANYSSNAGGEDTMGWTFAAARSDGLESTVTTYSGATLPWPWGGNGNSTGVVTTAIDANATTVTDQAQKQRRSITNGLGQLIRVDEPDAGGNLGLVSSPVQPTSYAYDPLGDLIQINQGGQIRTFTYSSLSRLLTANNPESGLFQFGYDANGNLTSKSDARGISTTFVYDALNRVTFRNYSDSTPDVTYAYDDVSVPFSRGKLTKVSSTVSESLITAYDVNERITGSQENIDGQTYVFGYAYNMDDELRTQTYPSAKVVEVIYDSSGDISRVEKQNGLTYADSFTYAPHGQIEKLRFGNGRWETTQFNSRQQITQVGLGYSATDTGLWQANYEFGDWQGSTLDPTKNNNSLARQTITVPTIGVATGFTATQTYTYDTLDRLKSSTETIGGGQTWKQTFNYDRFGNKTYDVTNTTTLGSCPGSVCNPSANMANNRLTGYGYDNAGNVTTDAEGRTFTYDAENRQLTAVGSGLSMSYSYDGNGKRVKSYNALTNQTTIFVYDAEGKLAAEYTVNVPPPASPTISYLTEDALGSPRVVTNSLGEVKARRDFFPFGEEIGVGIGSRNTNQKYSSTADDIRKKFATYQRDAETGLDFAQSRYYQPKHGRFTSPDEFKGDPDELFDFEEDASDNPTFYADLTNPRSLNKYQYAYNNPYKFNDPDGHCPTCAKAWIVAEISLTVWDIVETVKTYRDPNASRTEKVVMTAGTVIGIIGPGGGYGAGAKLVMKALKREGAEVVTRNVAEGAASKVITAASRAPAKNAVTKQTRLKQLQNDPKESRPNRGWVKQEQNQISRGKRNNIRVPPGKQLAHPRGQEAAKGYGHKNSKLQDEKLHKTQHKYDNYGRKNKERPDQQ